MSHRIITHANCRKTASSPIPKSTVANKLLDFAATRKHGTAVHKYRLPQCKWSSPPLSNKSAASIADKTGTGTYFSHVVRSADSFFPLSNLTGNARVTALDAAINNPIVFLLSIFPSKVPASRKAHPTKALPTHAKDSTPTWPPSPLPALREKASVGFRSARRLAR